MATPSAPSSSEHYAWNADTARRAADLAALNVNIAPRLVTSGSSETVASPTGASSAWNSAGTWEERVITPSATASLKARLLALEPPPQRALSARLVSVDFPSSEVRLISTRGTLRVGFELALKGSWELRGADGGVAAAGAFSIEEAADTDSDVFDTLGVTVSSATGCAKGEAVAVMKLADGAIRDAFRAWVAALKSP